MLQQLYPSACLSPSIAIRNMVMHTLDQLIDPHPTQVKHGWDQNMCWISRSEYFHIYAKKVENLTLDLQRVRWIEELRLVYLFCFFGTHSSTPITIDGLVMSQNRWVYDQVTRVIPADRVAVMDRRSSLFGSGATFGLPQVPDVYKILEPLAVHPYFQYIPASVFHGYTKAKYTPHSQMRTTSL